jgi:GNAT superfamily N-acetyltransferase
MPFELLVRHDGPAWAYARGRAAFGNNITMLHAAVTSRRAEPVDIAAIRVMQERSLRELGAACYTPQEISMFLKAFSTMDDAVVHEGHYFITVMPPGKVVASGGWSQLKPGYSRGHVEDADPQTATIRSVFVDPDLSRNGLGSSIMRGVEGDARAHGVSRLTLAATLQSIPFYLSLGYRQMHAILVELGDVSFTLMRMEKQFGAG